MNKVILIGRLARDVELRYTQSNMAVAQVTVAVNRPKREDGTQDADFINCVVWDKLAENLQKYCQKGSQIAVEGRIQVRNYESQDGTKRYVTEVVASNITYLDTKKDSQSSNQEELNNMSDGQVVQKALEEDPFKDFGEEVILSDDDLPF